ncbi:hypothetical protein QBC41DRAFT_318963 [Cercophora samala]|uniref:Uncharacterized protein n=1 Tax=Cercophora samala TaxID=330535 RepID=A0AA40DB18_9PEZI|nr:hypothetical protein QBC41DRAFT_318963 [Cercophora samala]
MASLFLLILLFAARLAVGEQTPAPQAPRKRPRPWRIGDECPTEIIVTSIPNAQGRFPNMETIHTALLNCPNITTLKMEAHWDHGCVVMGNPYWMSLPFDPWGGERYQSALEVLTLDGYESDATGPPDPRYNRVSPEELEHNSQSSVPRVKDLDLLASTSEPERKKYSFDWWIETMDFSKLHTLHFVREGAYLGGNRYSLTENVANVLPPRLTGLRKLGLYFSLGQRFILRLPRNSLQSLAWRFPFQHDLWDKEYRRSDLPQNSPLVPVLQHQGASLKYLYFHADETPSASVPALSIAGIQHIIELAPGLNSLTIDLQRHNNTHDWPWEELKLLAQGLPELVDLTVYVDLFNKTYCRENYFNPYDDGRKLWKIAKVADCVEACIAKPRVDEYSVADIARFLWKYKSGKALHRFTLRAGDWMPRRIHMGGPGDFEGRRAQGRCTVVDAVRHVDALGPIRCEAWSTDLYSTRSIGALPLEATRGSEDTYLDYFR